MIIWGRSFEASYVYSQSKSRSSFRKRSRSPPPPKKKKTKKKTNTVYSRVFLIHPVPRLPVPRLPVPTSLIYLSILSITSHLASSEGAGNEHVLQHGCHAWHLEMKSIFTKTRSFVSRLCFLIEKTEKSRRKRMTMGSEKVRGETARGVNSKNSGQTSLLERFRQRSLYSVAVSFVRFLQWFLSILFFGPIQRAWRPFSVGLLQTKLPWNNPKTARIFVVDNTLLCDKLLKSYRSHYPFKINFLGIDCEWVNREGQANAPVALLQIATPLCDCFLIRLHKMEGQMPQSVKELLEDKSVLKFGVGVQDDVKRLSDAAKCERTFGG